MTVLNNSTSNLDNRSHKTGM